MAFGYTAAGSNDSAGPKFAKDNDGTGDWPYDKVAFGADGTQTKVADSNGARLPVKAQPIGVSATDGSGAVGTSDVTLAAQNLNRMGLLISAPATNTFNVWFNLGAAATVGSGSVCMSPGGPPLYLPGVTDAVHAIAEGASQALTVKSLG